MIIQNFIKYNFSLNTGTRQNINKYTPAFKSNGSCKTDTFEKTQHGLSLKTKDGVINYTKDNRFSDFKFNNAKNLKETLETLKHLREEYKIFDRGILSFNYIYEAFPEVFEEELKDMKFVRFLGSGNNAIALENTDGKVVKLTNTNHFSFRRGIENFDAKIYRKNKSEGFYNYYIQEKCSKENLKEGDVRKVAEMIRAKGYEAFDMSIDQIGINKDGKLCLLDPECARNTALYEKMKKEVSQWLLKYGLDEDYI